MDEICIVWWFSGVSTLVDVYLISQVSFVGVASIGKSQDVGPVGRIPPKKQLVDLSCNLVSL